MNKLTQIRTHRLIVPVLAVSGFLLFGTVAFAAIVTGTSLIQQSTDVTYTQLLLTVPTDAVNGDLLLATVSVKNGSSSVISTPSGWTLIARTDNATNVGLATYYHVVGSAEPASYSWNISPTTHAVGGITRYSGVDTTNPIDITASATGHSLTPTAPSVTTSGDGVQVIAIFTVHGGDKTQHFTTPTGMVEQYDTEYNPNGPSIALDDETQTSAGATGSMASSIPSGIGRDWVAQTITLRAGGEALFTDDFHRADDSTTVGNGWLQESAGSGTSEGISSNRYFSIGSDFGNSLIYRSDISQQSGVAVVSSFSSPDLTNLFRITMTLRASVSSNAHSGYGVDLSCSGNTVSIVDQDTELAIAPFTACNDSDVFEMEMDVSAAPQNWIDLYVWDATTNTKPSSPTLVFHNNGANYAPLAFGSQYTLDARSQNQNSSSTFYSYLYKVNSI